MHTFDHTLGEKVRKQVAKVAGLSFHPVGIGDPDNGAGAASNLPKNSGDLVLQQFLRTNDTPHDGLKFVPYLDIRHIRLQACFCQSLRQHDAALRQAGRSITSGFCHSF